eukprot:TRINITY_DN16303_c0_g1_i1.p1 TRINITY_DN16303_c0_g1~~TRINITY_DN16303_c0_g1_i1.p1  ORF type:complete len:153 (-),score=14.06 TRINITY_DN16303_c0_g1_i1:273-731(-)
MLGCRTSILPCNACFCQPINSTVFLAALSRKTISETIFKKFLLHRSTAAFANQLSETACHSDQKKAAAEQGAEHRQDSLPISMPPPRMQLCQWVLHPINEDWGSTSSLHSSLPSRHGRVKLQPLSIVQHSDASPRARVVPLAAAELRLGATV